MVFLGTSKYSGGKAMNNKGNPTSTTLIPAKSLMKSYIEAWLLIFLVVLYVLIVDRWELLEGFSLEPIMAGIFIGFLVFSGAMMLYGLMLYYLELKGTTLEIRRGK
jgi:hypothetical protein